MKSREIKTIDIQAKEWFDKVNGNSYFSATVTINYGLMSETEILVPMQYGYGDSYEYAAYKAIKKELGCFQNVLGKDISESPTHAYAKYKIIVRRNIQTGCKKKDL